MERYDECWVVSVTDVGETDDWLGGTVVCVDVAFVGVEIPVGADEASAVDVGSELVELESVEAEQPVKDKARVASKIIDFLCIFDFPTSET